MKRTQLRRKSLTNKKVKKGPTITDLKKKLWELCKTLTRKHYGNVCFTCDKHGLVGSNWHTGHFLTSSTCSTELRYDLKNLRPQCYHCNINLSGNWQIFEERLIHTEGQAYVDELKARNKATKGGLYDTYWVQQKIAEYSNMV
jgi:hypothetical protein